MAFPRALARSARRCAGGARALALLALGALAGCTRSDEEWRSDLADPDVFVRGVAAIALVEQSPREAAAALPVLVEIARGPRPLLREPAARALDRLAPIVADDLIEQLQSGAEIGAPARKELVASLGSAGPAAVPKILAALRAPGRANVRELGGALAAIGVPAVEPLIEALRAETDDKQRIGLIWTLGELGSRARTALPLLLEAAADGSTRVRATAVESLQRVEPYGPRVRRVLDAAARSEEPLERQAAARALARLHVVQASMLVGPARAGELAALIDLDEAAWTALVDLAGSIGRERGDSARAGLAAIGAALVVGPKSGAFVPRANGAAGERDSPFDGLFHDQAAVRGASALLLARQGRAALPALPMLRELALDVHPGVAICASAAVFAIALDACGPLVGPRRAETGAR